MGWPYDYGGDIGGVSIEMETPLKTMTWHRKLLRFWPFWAGYIELEGFAPANYENMCDWLDEVCLNRYLVFVKQNFRTGVFSGESHWIRVTNHFLKIPSISHNHVRIYFRKESDVALFMLTFKGDT